MRDAEIREGLLAELRKKFVGDPLRPEMGLCLGETRVDIAVINGALHGYEIKSPHDKLTRLPRQVILYNRVLDYCTIVTGRRHSDRILAKIPTWWGVIEAEQVLNAGSSVVFNEVRQGRRNSGVDPFSVAQLLWRDEAAQELSRRGEYVARKETRWDLWDRLALIPLTELQECVRATLSTRSNWPSASQRKPNGD